MNEQGCAVIRPLLFAAIDGEVSREERFEVHAHLAVCASCRAWEASERALTALMTERPATVRRSIRTRVLAVAGALSLSALLLLLLPSAVPHGSLVQRQLGPGLDWQVSGERTLLGKDLVDVPAVAAASVRLGDGVQLDSVGPSRFALEATAGQWRVSVLAGTVMATVGGSERLAVGAGDPQQIGGGRWRLSVGDGQRVEVEPAAQDPVRGDLAALLAEGLGCFGAARPVLFGGSAADEFEKLQAAEQLLREVLAARDVTPEQSQQAMFYLAAAVSRQGRDDEAFKLETQWLSRFPDGVEASLVRFYMADHLRKKGRTVEAQAFFERVSGDQGDTALGEAARAYLKMMAKAKPGQAPLPQEGETVRLTAKRAPQPARTVAKGCAYLVVPVALAKEREADAGYVAAARAAAAFHKAEEWPWDGADFAALEKQLRERMPENVLFVLRPEQLDLVLHRRLLLVSAAVDDDWFADFAFGYLTAESGPACERLWQRIVTVHGRGVLKGVWWQASVTSNKTSLEYPNGVSPVAAAAGFQGPHYYWSTKNADREPMIERAFETMGKAAVVELTGCGDPQGIWLFDDQRNMQRERHWDYAPERVGQDADGSMPRLLAERFRKTALDAPILWSGTCHSGAVCRVFVEGDIVSTFGRTARATVHRLAPVDSLALSWLEAGAASMLVPLGANHGMSVAMEVDFALRNGASLGETVKSTWDDVLLAAQGRLVLDLPVDGQPHENREQVMQGGGSNRILIGDPALRPFRAVDSAAEVVKVERTATGMRVVVERTATFQPRAWDMYGGARDRDWRVLVRVDLSGPGLLERTDFTASVTARDAKGAGLPCAMQRLAVEDHHGRRFLHLQANGKRADLQDKAGTFVFEVVAK